MHNAVREYVESVKLKFPHYFRNGRILEVGSLDLNGSARSFFEGDFIYTGIDPVNGRNVDWVTLAHHYDIETYPIYGVNKVERGGDFFDVVLSTECFEHDRYWDLTFLNMWRLTRAEGLVLFTCASDDRGEHGTSRVAPKDSPLIESLGDYYMNLNDEHFNNIFNLGKMFHEYFFDYHGGSAGRSDMRFHGIKKK